MFAIANPNANAVSKIKKRGLFRTAFFISGLVEL